jgi:transposase
MSAPQHDSAASSATPATSHAGRQFARRTRAQQALAVVGVDAGKYQHAMVVRPRGGADSRPLLFATTRPGFEEAVAAIRAVVGPGATGEVLVGIEFAGMYGFTFAHYLHALSAPAADATTDHATDLRFTLASVLPAHTKRWKEVTHRLPLKTDRKDAVGICDLTAQGHYVSFPFLATAYAELRHLLSAREKLSTLRRGVITRLRTTLDVVFPEFPTLFVSPTKKTARALLCAYPGPEALRRAPKREVLALLKRESRNHLGRVAYERLLEAATQTVALPVSQSVMSAEIPLLIARLELYEQQMLVLEALMQERLATLPAAQALLTIPNVAPLTAAVLLGSIGDPQSYDSSRQILALAGLTLVERSSGVRTGQKRISKRGRPVLRKHAHMFAVRSVQRGGIFRAEYDALLARNGRKTIPALTAVARKGLKLLFSVAHRASAWTPERPTGEAAAPRSPEAAQPASSGSRRTGAFRPMP